MQAETEEVAEEVSGDYSGQCGIPNHLHTETLGLYRLYAGLYLAACSSDQRAKFTISRQQQTSDNVDYGGELQQRELYKIFCKTTEREKL